VHRRGIAALHDLGSSPRALKAVSKCTSVPTMGMVPVTSSALPPSIRSGHPGPNHGRGVMPHHEIRPTWQDVVSGNDLELAMALELIASRKS
jgi:hypothetical protein